MPSKSVGPRRLPLPLPYERGSRWWGDFKRLKGGRHPLIPEGETRGLEVLGRDSSDEERTRNETEARQLLQRDWDRLQAEIARKTSGKSEADAGYARALRDAFISWKTASTNSKVRVTPKELKAIARGCKRIFELPCAQRWLLIQDFNDEAHIETIVGELREMRTKDGRPYAEATIRQWCMAICGLMSYARQRGFVMVNLWQSSPSIPDGAALNEERLRIPQHFLTPAEIRAVLRQADLAAKRGLSHRNPHLRAVTYVLAYSGARISEVLRLRVGDVDLQRNLLLVRATKKGEMTREVPLHAPLRAVLAPLLTGKQPLDLLFPSVNKRKDKDPVAEEKRKKAGARPMLGVARGMKQLLSAAGIQREKFLSPREIAQLDGVEYAPKTDVREARARAACQHIWRHSYAMVRLGMVQVIAGQRPLMMGLHQVAKELGHTTETQIRDTYANRPDRVTWLVTTLDYRKAPGPSPAQILAAARGRTATTGKREAPRVRRAERGAHASASQPRRRKPKVPSPPARNRRRR